MGGKFKMEAPGIEPIRVEVKGIDDILYAIQEYESSIARYERFTEHVLLSCLKPEVPRLILGDGDWESMMDNAHDALQKILVRYRKMVSWFRANSIDVESVVGDNEGIKS